MAAEILNGWILDKGHPTLVDIWEHFSMWLNFMKEENDSNEKQRLADDIL